MDAVPLTWISVGPIALWTCEESVNLVLTRRNKPPIECAGGLLASLYYTRLVGKGNGVLIPWYTWFGGHCRKDFWRVSKVFDFLVYQRACWPCTNYSGGQVRSLSNGSALHVKRGFLIWANQSISQDYWRTIPLSYTWLFWKMSKSIQISRNTEALESSFL